VAWRQRGRKQYLYLVRRDQSGRVRTHYAGSGPKADALAEQLEARKRARQRETQEHVAEKLEVGRLAALSSQIDREVSLLVSAVLIVSGFYVHKREWRSRGRRLAKHL
jgi:hypothetical protein